jgi:hypothetical protein
VAGRNQPVRHAAAHGAEPQKSNFHGVSLSVVFAVANSTTLRDQRSRAKNPASLGVHQDAVFYN